MARQYINIKIIITRYCTLTLILPLEHQNIYSKSKKYKKP